MACIPNPTSLLVVKIWVPLFAFYSFIFFSFCLGTLEPQSLEESFVCFWSPTPEPRSPKVGVCFSYVLTSEPQIFGVSKSCLVYFVSLKPRDFRVPKYRVLHVSLLVASEPQTPRVLKLYCLGNPRAPRLFCFLSFFTSEPRKPRVPRSVGVFLDFTLKPPSPEVSFFFLIFWTGNPRTPESQGVLSAFLFTSLKVWNPRLSRSCIKRSYKKCSGGINRRDEIF